jgi:hemoglobin-like flavoprotein
MTPEQTELVRETWERVNAEGEAVALSFYERLFEVDPLARQLFAKADMSAQRSKLMQVWSFGQGLGDAWTREAEAAWERAYALVSSIMSRAGEEPTDRGSLP